jgi:ATP synthase protein I
MIDIAFSLFLKQMFFIIFPFLTAGCIFTPFSPHFIGAAAGFLVSLYCMWILGRRIKRMEQRIQAGKLVPSLAFFNRSAAAVLGAMILYNVELEMAMPSFATGILGGYFLMVINVGFYCLKEAKQYSIC